MLGSRLAVRERSRDRRARLQDDKLVLARLGQCVHPTAHEAFVLMPPDYQVNARGQLALLDVAEGTTRTRTRARGHHACEREGFHVGGHGHGGKGGACTRGGGGCDGGIARSGGGREAHRSRGHTTGEGGGREAHRSRGHTTGEGGGRRFRGQAHPLRDSVAPRGSRFWWSARIENQSCRLSIGLATFTALRSKQRASRSSRTCPRPYKASFVLP